MYQTRVFSVKLQLQFGGDFHEISVPAYGGAEPTVLDLMNVVERDFRVPKALQNLIFHGQELHLKPNEPLSRFGVKNIASIRLVGRMAPVDLIPRINAQFQANNYQQSTSSYSPTMTQQPAFTLTFHTTEQSLPYYYAPSSSLRKFSIGTQYDPPPSAVERPPTTLNEKQNSSPDAQDDKVPATPK